MNESLAAYKRSKFLENKQKELSRRYPEGVPQYYNETTEELKREFKRFIDSDGVEE